MKRGPGFRAHLPKTMRACKPPGFSGGPRARHVCAYIVECRRHPFQDFGAATPARVLVISIFFSVPLPFFIYEKFYSHCSSCSFFSSAHVCESRKPGSRYRRSTLIRLRSQWINVSRAWRPNPRPRLSSAAAARSTHATARRESVH